MGVHSTRSWNYRLPKRRCDFCGDDKPESQMIQTKLVIDGKKYSVCKIYWGGRTRGRGLVPIEEHELATL